MQQYLISLLIFTPLVAAIVGLILPAKSQNAFRYLTLFANGVQIILLLTMIFLYEKSSSSMQFVAQHPWITLDLGAWGVLKATYFVGVDGLSFPLVILSVFILSITTISSWTVNQNVKGYFVMDKMKTERITRGKLKPSTPTKYVAFNTPHA